jgi:hypothetical protein
MSDNYLAFASAAIQLDGFKEKSDHEVIDAVSKMLNSNTNRLTVDAWFNLATEISNK